MAATLRDHAQRLGTLVAVVVVANFLLPRLLPGSPLSAGTGEGVVAFLPRDAVAAMRRDYGLDEPLGRQFTRYLRGLVRGDLGTSLATGRPVTAVVGERLPWTLLLAGSAVAISAALGMALGTLAVWRPHRLEARLAAWLVVGIGALPEFLLAMALIALATWSRRVPVGGAISPFLEVTGAGDVLHAAADVAAHVALPVATLVMALAPAIYLVSRNALAATIGDRYVMTARGKGLGERRVLRHVWRNALPPVLTLLGVRFAFAVTGVAVVERLFAYPGMGLLLFESVARRDYPMMQGVFLAASTVTVAVTVALDLAAGLIDPRTRRESV
jgi:peptide/nickel transport system permease protein